eukprot:Hpha_TRINITY_DN14413_c0_g1::TRINITY_DN14413_c0_g1_i1::g.157566::m.157566
MSVMPPQPLPPQPLPPLITPATPAQQPQTTTPPTQPRTSSPAPVPSQPVGVPNIARSPVVQQSSKSPPPRSLPSALDDLSLWPAVPNLPLRLETSGPSIGTAPESASWLLAPAASGIAVGDEASGLGARQVSNCSDMLDTLLGFYPRQQSPVAAPASSPTSVLTSAPSDAAGHAGEAAEAAQAHLECAVCFDPLCARPVVVFLGADGRRARNDSDEPCRHYFHAACVRDLRRDGTGVLLCPLCRAPFETAHQLPDPGIYPREWFDLVDANGTGALVQWEVRDVLLACTGVDEKRLSEQMAERWYDWDPGRTGSIRFEAVEALLQFVRMKVPGRRSQPPPSLLSDCGAWFEFWDRCGHGRLTQGQLSRAVIKSLSGDFRHTDVIEIVATLFPTFAENPLSPILRGEGDQKRSISRGGFVKSGGMSEHLIAALQEQGLSLAEPGAEEDERIARAIEEHDRVLQDRTPP